MIALPHRCTQGTSAISTHPRRLFWLRGAAGLALLLLCMALATPSLAQGAAALEVLVVSRESGRPLPGASVSVPELRLGALTDPTGHVLLPVIPARSLAVEIAMIGHRTERVDVAFVAGETARLQVPLTVEAVALEGVRVTGTAGEESVPRLDRAGYYARRKMNPGTFVSPRAMEQRRRLGGNVSDVLRAATGVYLQPVFGGGYAAYSTRSAGLTSEPCPLAVFVDGLRQLAEPRPPDPNELEVNRLQAGLSMSSSDREPMNIDRVLPLDDIEAMEIYSGRATPLQFQVPPVCGAVVIWTRSSMR